MRVAIVHDWLTVYGGAERVLEQIIAAFPDADLFAVVDFVKQRDFLHNKPVKTTFIQRFPWAAKRYRLYLPFMPLAIEQLDLSAYDLVISSSYAVAKGVITGPEQIHISYVYTPIRYAWDLQHEYLRESGLERGLRSWMARLTLHYIRVWDLRTVNGVDHFIACSRFIEKRIRKVYRRESTVIYPPVALDRFNEGAGSRGDFYLTASRLVPYKRIDLIVQAFSRMPDRKLVVIGDGPEMDKIRKLAGPNVELLGYQPFEVLLERMQTARAFIFAAREDFGIAPVEAQACGTPVIAFGHGGATETIVGLSADSSAPNPTGVYFNQQNIESLTDAIARFEAAAERFEPGIIRRNAERFSTEKFLEQFKDFVDRRMV